MMMMESSWLMVMINMFLGMLASSSYAFIRPCLPLPSIINPPSRPFPSCSATIRMMMDEQMEIPRAIYIHLPFCRRRCYYCDFPIKVVGDRPGAAIAPSEDYVNLLLRELDASLPSAVDPTKVKESGGLSSIFFGGGTPSLTPPPLVDKILRTLQSRFGFSSDIEISMEMDPGTFDGPRLQAFLDCGITRVSMGVQSFDKALLTACGRAHSLEDVYQAIKTLHDHDVINFSIDLISGLPNQTLAQWNHSLQEVIQSGAAHVSVYDLQVETGTAFGRWYTPGDGSLPAEDSSAKMYATASSILRQIGDYEHYEVSNYAKPGHQCRHNRVYWEGKPFLALGNGAASYIGWHRFSRPRSLIEYKAWIERLEQEGWEKATGYDQVKKASTKEQRTLDRLEDLFMVGLRLKEGLDPLVVAQKAGMSEKAAHEVSQACQKAVQRFADISAVVIEDIGEEDERTTTTTTSNGNSRSRIRLVDSEGFLLSNEIIAEIFVEIGRKMEEGLLI